MELGTKTTNMHREVLSSDPPVCPAPAGRSFSCYGIGSLDSDRHGRLLKQLGSAGLEASTGLPDDSFPGDRPQGFSSQAWAVNVSPSGCNSRPFPLFSPEPCTMAGDLQKRLTLIDLPAEADKIGFSGLRDRVVTAYLPVSCGDLDINNVAPTLA